MHYLVMLLIIVCNFSYLRALEFSVFSFMCQVFYIDDSLNIHICQVLN